jgi:anti-sigma regulatory factor (Ser/Thr protein kinase)
MSVDHAAIEIALLEEVDAHPRDLVRVVAKRFSTTRPTVLARVAALVADDYLRRSGKGTRPVYQRGASRRQRLQLPIAGLAEDLVFSRHVAPLLEGVAANIREIAQHAITEMINNAIDHSAGRSLTLLVDRNPERLRLVVDDDGVGIFRKIARHAELPDERLALLELAKGKFTTDPRRHSGEGVFFTSRMCDRFQILSGELVFDHDSRKPLDWLDASGIDRDGTTVVMEILLSSPRTTREVFERYSSGPDDYSFARTVVPVALARIGDDQLVSRSQAKRLLQRVERFAVVELDFRDVRQIGQAFADEVFRVFALDHPDIELIATHACAEVQQMIRRAETARDRQRLNGDLFT